MPVSALSQLHLGKIDGKHEFLDSKNDSEFFFDGFLVPDVIEIDEFLCGSKFIITGFRGTGKTSLLRYLSKQLADGGAKGQIVLFKSGLSETQKQEISKLSGVSLEELKSEKIEIAQDFKESWRWFFHRKIGELINNGAVKSTNDEQRRKYLELLGLTETPWFDKVLGGFPKIEGARIRVKGGLSHLLGSIDATLRSNDSKKASILFSTVVDELDDILKKLGLKSLVYIYVDELEVFFVAPEQYKRDLRLVRDLIFAAERLMLLEAEAKLGIRICVAVRSEVLDALGSEGQEVGKLTHDRGVNISWHHARRDAHHPLLEIIRKKIWISEKRANVEQTEDPVEYYFPKTVRELPLDVFLLDQSFYKPRDLVWRLSIAQQQNRNAEKFTSQVLEQTDIDYSAKLWEEIQYELTAVYTKDEISTIEALFSGQSVFFDRKDIDVRFDVLRRTRQRLVDNLLNRRGVDQLLQDLYRLGAIGNAFRVGPNSRDVRNRWVFRGDATLLIDKRMELHPALIKKLAAVRPKRRSGRRPPRV